MTPPPEKLDAPTAMAATFCFFQFLTSLLRFRSGWSANFTAEPAAPQEDGEKLRLFTVQDLALLP